MSEKMRAIQINQYGDNSVLEFKNIDRPEPKGREVLVKVHAAGINPIDWKIRSGAGQRMGLTLPIHLGGEISGTVEKLGDDVSEFNVGDGVYGIIKSGGFSDYAIAQVADIAHKPANIDFINAAAIALGSLTAWQAMFDIAKLTSGQRLFITNGSGGVGSMAVQIAKAKGVHVTAMASGRNEEYVRSLGVDEFVDYTLKPFEEVVHDMDVVFDTVGGDTFQRAFQTLKTGGFLVTSVVFPGNEAEQHHVGVARVQCKPNAMELELISDLVRTGKLKAHVAEIVPFVEVARAFELSEGGHTRGKIILRVC